jgi:NADH-quinone oxidoreductase subunit K
VISHYLLFASALFSIGAYGVLARRNILIILMSLELMLNGVNVAFVALSLVPHTQVAAPHGQVFVLMVMAVAAAEVAVGLAIVIALFRTRQTVDINDLQMMSG